MAKVVSAISAKVEKIGKLKEGNYGPYRSVLFLDQAYPRGAEEAKIWKSLSDEETQNLREGATVQLVPSGTDKNGNTKHQIVTMDSPPTATRSSPPLPSSPSPAAIVTRPTSVPPTWNPQDKQQLCALVTDYADLFKFCIATVQHKMEEQVESRDYRAIATTLFLQAVNTIPASAPEPAATVEEAEFVPEDDIPY
ncbi:MAG TPA: hypothetical protein V6D18_11110 [Thermosynechococcaceae cyanobacterium]